MPARPAWRVLLGGLLALTMLALLAPACTTAESEGCSSARGSGERPTTPNVLLIVTDDQRGAGTLDVMDFTRKWFAENGTDFPNAFATTPLCCPSRSSIFTGQYAHNHGVKVNPAIPNLDPETLIQKRLQDAGYKTGFVGKYFNAWRIKDPLPYFDRFTFFTPERRTTRDEGAYLDMKFNRDGKRGHVRRYSTHYIRDRALSYLSRFERQDERPWFVMVAPYAPHLPATAEPKYERAPVPRFRLNPALRESDTNDKSDVYPTSENTDAKHSIDDRNAQLRSLMSVDDMVKRFATRLECLGETRDTVAIFTSDNGYLWGEHGFSGKGKPYRESVAVPLLIRWTEGGHPRVDRRMAANIDLAPTIAEAAGLPQESLGHVDGESLTTPGPGRKALLFEYWSGEKRPMPGWASIRTNSFQYVEYETPEGDVVARELYDLKNDPWQLENVLRDDDPSNDPSAARLNLLERRLRVLRTCAGTTCP
ncbi:MAG: sulfatase [Actinomycetota bacterium]|nr:sulfatase [Actinomycetota bacterium]